MAIEGTVLRLQVQRSSLKAGEAPRRWYDPGPIVTVSSLQVSADGVTGGDDSGAKLLDVHNATHPASKNREHTNGISICFTSHYRAMRERFGAHLVDGIAGENILVDTDRMMSPDDLPPEIVIRDAEDREIRIHDIIVAPPCVEFARFALQHPPDAKPDRTVTEAVRFLHDGMRGYYARFDGPAGLISIGDTVGM